MKTDKTLRYRNRALGFIPLFLIAAFIFTSCEDKIVPEDPFFSIEGSPTGLTVTKAAKTQSYVVRSNKSWEIVEKEEADWVKVFPAKGEADGIFKIIVNANETFDARTVNYAFIVDGTEQPVLFRVDQAANVPYITVPATITIPSAGGDVIIDVASNVTWSYTLSDNSWLTEKAVTSTKITLTALENTSIDPRQVTMTMTAPDFPAVSQPVTLIQSPGTVVLEENFNWLQYGSPVFYTTTGETRYDAWTQEQKDRGWTSTVNTVTGSGTTPLCYARQGFVKLGKTTYGGDLITPVLAKITGTQNLLVTFKAVPYMTAAGTLDDNILNISIIGPGTISQSQFIIDNWPVYPAADVEAYCIALWGEPAATRTFTITGATAETQIKFLGGDYALSGVGAGKNRIFLDDIKIEIVP